MFEFKGTAADSPESSRPDWRVVDHRNIQDLGRRPFTTMLLPAHHQRSKTESAKRPSLPLRTRSNSSAPNYSRSQDRDDLSPLATPLDLRTPRLFVDKRVSRQSIPGGTTHTRGDSLDTFAPKAWMAKGSKLLKRQNSKHELTSLRTLDWVEDGEEARVRHLPHSPPPPEFRHNKMRSSGDPNAAPRLNISEPFNFHHITHTRPHHVQKLERADPNDLVSEFSALRASQASQPELRGIKAKDIPREDSPRDALLPDSPSQLRNDTAGLTRLTTYQTRNSAVDSPCGATSPARVFEYPPSTGNFSQPSSPYHTVQISPTSQASSRHLTPDLFMFNDDSLSDVAYESPIQTESPEPDDYSIGTWNHGAYDLASPHAVTTDDDADWNDADWNDADWNDADWNRQVPFSMVRTELEPVEEDDESEEKRDSILAFIQRPTTTRFGSHTTESSHSTNTICWGSDPRMQEAEKIQDQVPHSMLSAEESPCASSARSLPDEDVTDPLHIHYMPSTKMSGPSIEDPLDDIPVRPRFSRCLSVGPSDMMGFWDVASDAINCSYALGAEGNSNFDWHGSSIDKDDMAEATAIAVQPDAANTASESPNEESRAESPSSSRTAANRSSSVYSSPPSPLLPLQTFPSNVDPPSASSTESSFSSIAEAVTPSETTESAMEQRFSAMNCKEWCRPTYIVSNDLESQTVQEDLYHQMYTSDYPQEAPFQIHNVGRVDGSTISNSPRSSRSPISKSSSQESFWYSQAALNARRTRNAGSVGSLPELMSSKNSRERFDHAIEQSTDNLACANPSETPTDSQHTTTAQRRRSPNLAKDVAQNIMLSKVRTAEEPLPLLPAARERAASDVTSPTHDPSLPPPTQLAAGRRMRSGSSASNLSARGSRGSYNVTPPVHTHPVPTTP